MLDSVVHARLPRGGLGNKLLVWARAKLFAERWGMPLYVSGWAEIKIGPYLRGERTKRQYWGYFDRRHHAGLVRSVWWSCTYREYVEPAMDHCPSSSKAMIYVFNRVPDWPDYFKDLRGHEPDVRRLFIGSLSDRYRDAWVQTARPEIGMHVRLSDFRTLRPGEVPGQHCNVRLPLEYYSDVIRRLRDVAGKSLPVTIFTDGHVHEVQPLLDMPDVRMAGPAPDIVDLMRLARSRCLVVSAGSTFSYWAAYMSEAPVILHPSNSGCIRSVDIRRKYFEGSLDMVGQNSTLLAQNLRSLEPYVGNEAIDA